METTHSEDWVFRMTLVTVLAGLCTFFVRAALKSNCVEFKACGVSCKRDHATNPAELELEAK
jgi:hypothetical protein